MSFWSVMNWIAWGLSACVAALIIVDFIRVERGQSKKASD